MDEAVRRQTILTLSLGGLLAAGCGCGEVATPAYPGEALAILRGVVVNPAGLTLPAAASAHLVWTHAIGSADASQVAAGTTVETRLPANFSIALYTTPPAAAVEATGGVPQARGEVVVVTDAQLATLSAGGAVTGVHGRTDAFQLLWLPDDTAASVETATRNLQAPLAAGFNLLGRTGCDGDDGDSGCVDGERFAPVPLTSIIALELVEGRP
jgi:hypothetical protein